MAQPEFHLYSQLPREARRRIWELSLPPRVHHLYLDKGQYAIKSSGTLPPAFRCSSESRAAALSVYKKISSPPHDDTVQHRFIYIQEFYFQPDIDILFFDHDLIRKFSGTFFSRFEDSFLFKSIQQQHVKNVAVERASLAWLLGWHSVDGVLREDSWIRGLRSLYVVSVDMSSCKKVMETAKLRGTWTMSDANAIEWASIDPSFTVLDALDDLTTTIKVGTLICEEDDAAYRRQRPKVPPVQPKEKERKNLSRFLSYSYLDKKITGSRFLSAQTGSSYVRLTSDRGSGVYAMGKNSMANQ